MLIQQKKTEIERSQVASESTFKIKASQQAFKILSDGLYSNKVLAIVRELSCNAYDSHIAAKKADVPFEIHLPTKLEQFFYIRDFGTGLDHNDTINLYTTYFESTKSQSNDFIGALGLGSKSPFCYTDSFSVTVFFNKEKRIYNAFLNEHGIPSIALLQTLKTEEENGIEIRFPVKEVDNNTFMNNTIQALKFFKVKPKVLGQGEDFYKRIANPEYILQGSNFGVRQYKVKWESTVRAIQGQVAYPISSSDIPNIDSTHSRILNIPLDIFFEIGELDVAASREQLSFNEFTIKNIQKRLDEIQSEMSDIITEKVKSFDTLWEACRFYSSVDHYIRSCLKLDDPHPFIKHIDKSGATINFETEVLNKYDFVIKEFNRKLKPYEYTNKINKKLYINLNDEPIIVINDLNRGLIVRIRQNNYKSHKFIVIEADSKKVINKIIKELGNPKTILASELNYVKETRAKYKRNKVHTLDCSSRYLYANEEEDFDPTVGGFFVPYYDKAIFKDYGTEKVYDMGDICYKAISLGILNADDVKSVKKFNFKQYEKYSQLGDWTNLYEHIGKQFRIAAMPKYIDLIRSSLGWRQIESATDYSTRQIFASLIDSNSNSPLFNSLKEMRENYSKYTNLNNHSTLTNLYNQFGNDEENQKDAIAKANKLLKDIYSKYPLLEQCNTNGKNEHVIHYINLIDENEKRLYTKI